MIIFSCSLFIARTLKFLNFYRALSTGSSLSFTPPATPFLVFNAILIAAPRKHFFFRFLHGNLSLLAVYHSRVLLLHSHTKLLAALEI
jgi:hypothetical protein